MTVDEVNVQTMWPGRCRRSCKTVWWWPKAGHLYSADLENRPKCPNCGNHLSRTQTALCQDQNQVVARAKVGFE